MVCFSSTPIYNDNRYRGIKFASSIGDGYTVELQWFKALSPDTDSYNIAYNIYYSTNKNDVFDEGVKYVVINPDQTSANIEELTPGKVYYFAIRPTLHDSNRVNLALLPKAPNGCYIYPEAALLSDITATDITIPITDIDSFPAKGILKVGVELIYYTSKDIPTNSLIVSDRGILGTTARLHTTDGYDGVSTLSPIISFWEGFEDLTNHYVGELNKFDVNKYPRTNADGYREKTALTTTDLSVVDDKNEDYTRYDFTGYHRIDPVDLLSGKCVGSYWGGEHFCADGYNGIGRRIRGLSIQDINTRRQEVLLSTTGEPVVLVRRQYGGITNPSVTTNKESPEFRYPGGFGTELVTGFEQFFNPSRSDGRIIVRFGPTVEDIEQQEPGRENVFIPDCWTIVYPGIRDRDFLIRFNEDGTEEFRYEILKVTRNKTLINNTGAQKFTARRLRKTEPQYQYKVIADTSTMPTEVTTTIGSGGGILPHTHKIVINEGVISLAQINQTTSTDRGHSHVVINGEIQDMGLNHSHSIILP